MTETICIRNADWVIRWNHERDRHEYLRHADVAFTGNVIDFVGAGYDGTADREIEGSRLMVMPGLVNIHCHPTNQPISRSVREEFANPALFMTALYDRTNFWNPDNDALYYGAVTAYGELLKSGVTTTIDFARNAPEGWIDLMASSGLRVFASPAFREAVWSVEHGTKLVYHWDDDRGRRQFDQAMAFIDEAMNHRCGRLSAVVAPAQVDTCREETLLKSLAVARERGLMMQAHACQTLPEFHEMTRRTGKTPIQWMHQIGILGPNTAIAHAIFVDEHSWTHWYTREDLDLLAETGTTVAHCPVVFSRYGHRMESFGKYVRRGINMGIGTDSAPHNMLEEMRQAIIMSRAASGDVNDISATDVFNAATIGGARALQRDDIGRLCRGAKADIVLVDTGNPLMMPARDPLRNLIYTAADRAVRDVYVDGNLVVENGRVLTLDVKTASDRLEASQQRAELEVPNEDPEGRSGMELSPLVLPLETRGDELSP